MENSNYKIPLKKILYVNTDILEYERVRTTITGEDPRAPEVEWAPDKLSAIHCVKKNKYDVCLLDFEASHEKELETVKEIKNANSSLPIVLLTDIQSNMLIEKAKLAGASENLLKSNLDRYILEKTLRYLHQVDVNFLPDTEDKKDRIIKLTQAIGAETGEIAQEINTLLTIINGCANQLQEHIPRNNELYKYIDQIQRAVFGVDYQTQKLFAISRKNLLLPEKIDLRQVIEEMEPMFRSIVGDRASLEIHAAADVKLIKADRGLIGQAITCLIINAKEAMPAQEGQILVDIHNESTLDSENSDEISSMSRDYVCISVVDNGCGMDSNIQKHIFEPFFTTKGASKDKGLGLAKVNWIVRQSGGFINVESSPNGGSSFKIYFPIIHIKEHNPFNPNPKEKKKGSRGTVLIVEDEQSIRELIGEALSGQGYHVLEAGSSKVALSIFEAHPNKIDVLLTDVVLPFHSGPEMARAIKENFPETKIIFMSAHADLAHIRQNYHLACEGFLQKPFSLEELIQMVNQIVAAQ